MGREMGVYDCVEEDARQLLLMKCYAIFVGSSDHCGVLCSLVILIDHIMMLILQVVHEIMYFVSVQVQAHVHCSDTEGQELFLDSRK